MTTVTLPISQDSVTIAVDFYNEEEETALLSYPKAQEIEAIAGTTIEVPTAELLTYYLFHRKRPGKVGYRSFDELSQQIGSAYQDIEWGVEFDGKSIVSASDLDDDQDSGLVEHLGEAVALAVVNRIHGLTEADWDRIPANRGYGASFDYSHGDKQASDGEQPIQVEAKGTTSLGQPNRARARVSQQRTRIREKKTSIQELEGDGQYRYPASVRYGCVAILNTESTLRALLVDPEGEDVVRSPEALRIVNRMIFLRDWISLVAPRSQLASSLSTRTAALLALEDPAVLDGIALRKANGEPFNYAPGFALGRGHISILRNKSYVLDGPSGGILVQVSSNELYLLGIMEELVFLAESQSFSEILDYVREGGTVRKTVRCQFTDRQLKRMQLPDGFRERMAQFGPRYGIDLEGDLMYSPSGLVHGFLPME